MTMVSLLLLTQPLPRVISELPKILEAAAKYTQKRLYVHWDSLLPVTPNDNFHGDHSSIVSRIYQTSAIVDPSLDVRVILHGFKLLQRKWEICMNIDNFLIDFKNVEYLNDIKKKYEYISKSPHFLLDTFSSPVDNIIPKHDHTEVFDEVVIGGTFDKIHTGHKILLSESVMRTRKRLTIGMANGALLDKKTLKELISPCELRMKELTTFLEDIDSSIKYNLVAITEPMGPTSWDQSLQLIVVSEETEKVTDYINNYRESKGLSLLKKYVVKLVEDKYKCEGEELKYSSSSMRRRLLGTRFTCVKPNRKIPVYPYIIGLTGGSASGKSKIASYLSKLGAKIIDCDSLGHKAYTKGSTCHEKLLTSFGMKILAESGEIDRKSLGSIVFQSADQLKLLNGIVWPEIMKMANEEIDSFREVGTDVVVLDAAVLIQAGWIDFCHETWVCFVNKQEAVRRIMERDKKSRSEAEDRLARQMPNQDMLKYANVVLCSEFQYEFTQSQVQKAWNVLKSERKGLHLLSNY